MTSRVPSDERQDAATQGEQSESLAEELSMNLLAAGIPLTLLLDLAENFGPPSTQILEAEPADPSDPASNWLAHLRE